MRRGLSTTTENYIKVRVAQLKEDRQKASDELDKMWYTRLIQELNWVANHKENCSIPQTFYTSPEEQRIYDLRKTN
jgi:hypothetical protein